jgi:hypothetical protein
MVPVPTWISCAAATSDPTAIIRSSMAATSFSSTSSERSILPMMFGALCASFSTFASSA